MQHIKMSNPTLKVKDIVFGEGTKICLPIVENNKEDIIKVLDNYEVLEGWHVVEIRLDFLKDINEATDILLEAKKHTSRVILATIRTSREGGEIEISDEKYQEVVEDLLNHNACDLIDIEITRNKATILSLVSSAHKNDIKVIMSNHHFDNTPSNDELIEIFETMQILQGDLLKVAVMPQSKRDVTRFMDLSSELSTKLNKPLITMSMGSLGAISRVAGQITGSTMSFATSGKASAPGQISLESMKAILEVL